MNKITPNQLKGKPKRVGELDGDPVMEVETKGGLFLLMTKKNGESKTLGTGSHPATAAHIAERDFPKLKLTELSKSEKLDPYTLRKEAEKFTPLTRRFQYFDGK
jgi:hypothetical protein